MFKRNLDRFYYLLMLISLHTAYFLIKVVSSLHFLFPKTKKGDIIFFPHEQKGSDGYFKRFEQYFPFFKEDGISFLVCDIYDDTYIRKKLAGSTFDQYYLYHLIIWKRFRQVLKARHFKHAFIQRRLFACYPDSKEAHLEKLLRKLNDDITVDYWDSVWLNSPSLYQDITMHVDKISVVNQFVFNYFKDTPPKKYLFPIAVPLDRYIVKKDYKLKEEIRLFWTGLPGNIPHILSIAPVLQKLSQLYPISVVLVCAEGIKIEGVKIIQHKWQKETFFELLSSSDIGLYPCLDDEEGKGKMAMKVVEYMACGVPCVGNNVGLTPYARNHENIFIVSQENDWISAIGQLIENKDLREKLGRNGRKTIEQYHSVEKSYQVYKNVIFV